MQVDFKFEPLQRVKISAYDLHYSARILKCSYDGHTKNYLVEYAADGKLLDQTFFEDQLCELEA